MKSTCNYCLGEFEAKRSTASFCSDSHRTLWGRLSEEDKKERRESLLTKADARLEAAIKDKMPDADFSPVKKQLKEFRGELKKENEPVVSKDEPIKTHDDCNTEFGKFLSEFGFIIMVEPWDNNKLGDLKTRAYENGIMTDRQIDAIVARCDNAINGSYGKTKTKGHLSHSGLLKS